MQIVSIVWDNFRKYLTKEGPEKFNFLRVKCDVDRKLVVTMAATFGIARCTHHTRCEDDAANALTWCDKKNNMENRSKRVPRDSKPEYDRAPMSAWSHDDRHWATIDVSMQQQQPWYRITPWKAQYDEVQVIFISGGSLRQNKTFITLRIGSILRK
jgi:hypothetical protein